MMLTKPLARFTYKTHPAMVLPQRASKPRKRQIKPNARLGCSCATTGQEVLTLQVSAAAGASLSAGAAFSSSPPALPTDHGRDAFSLPCLHLSKVSLLLSVTVFTQKPLREHSPDNAQLNISPKPGCHTLHFLNFFLLSVICTSPGHRTPARRQSPLPGTRPRRGPRGGRDRPDPRAKPRPLPAPRRLPAVPDPSAAALACAHPGDNAAPAALPRPRPRGGAAEGPGSPPGRCR